MASEVTVKAVLELFQNCKSRGERASLSMETMNGKDITFSFSVHGPTGSPVVEEGRSHPSRRWKTPSQLRRDKQRKEKFLTKKMEESKKKETDAVGESRVVLTEPKDEIALEAIDQEDEECEKLFVIPRHKVDNHNIGIEYDVTAKLEAKGVKVKKVRVMRTEGILQGDFERFVVLLEPTKVKVIEQTNFGIVNCCVLPYT